MKSLQKLIFLFLCILIFNIFVFPIDYSNIPDKPTDRPSVALVLSGGGAKGFAHIPILELIEEYNIPVDIIIGTSVGSIIGGLYSIGYNSQELYNYFVNMDWVELFADEPVSPFETMFGEREKEANPVTLKFDENFSLQLGAGICYGQKIYELFKRRTIKIPSYTSFNNFQIPFRAVVTDLIAGDEVILEKGDIAEAIRASLSIPTVFSPYKIDNKLYIDGGVTNNLAINRAKEMGYDIIIASEVSEQLITDENLFNTMPLIVFAQTIYYKQALKNKPYYKDTKILVSPNLNDFSVLDFPKGKEIYKEGKKTVEKSREKFAELAKIFENTTHKKIIPYNNLDYLTVNKLELSNVLEIDTIYIEKLFEKLKQNKITEKSISEFLSKIYATGNYSNISTRIKKQSGENILEVTVIQLKAKKTSVQLSANYVGTIAANAQSKLTITTDFQLRGLTGHGSLFSARIDFVNSFAADLIFLQPINHKSYFQLFSLFNLDPNNTLRGFYNIPISNTSQITINGGFLFGFNFNSFNNLITKASVDYWNNTSCTTPSIEKQITAFPDNYANTSINLNIQYNFSTLNNYAFSSKGFAFSLDNKSIFPLHDNQLNYFNISSVSISTAIPVAKTFSFCFDTICASDITNTLQTIPNLIAAYGFSLMDRHYFPQHSGLVDFGTHKLFASLGIQINPWGNLTILGGQLFFTATASCGNVWMDYKNISLENLSWCGNAGIGLRIKNKFSLYGRIGVGTSCEKVTPFASFDFGTIRY
ncbi:MAG: patatin-like phospholipase family protein [Treponema sp.]|nr:patatin-like phospholipase family protein [Treponema sp.]